MLLYCLANEASRIFTVYPRIVVCIFYLLRCYKLSVLSNRVHMKKLYET